MRAQIQTGGKKAERAFAKPWVHSVLLVTATQMIRENVHVQCIDGKLGWRSLHKSISSKSYVCSEKVNLGDGYIPQKEIIKTFVFVGFNPWWMGESSFTWEVITIIQTSHRLRFRIHTTSKEWQTLTLKFLFKEGPVCSTPGYLAVTNTNPLLKYASSTHVSKDPHQ